MTVKPLFMRWLRHQGNAKYLSDLSASRKSPKRSPKKSAIKKSSDAKNKRDSKKSGKVSIVSTYQYIKPFYPMKQSSNLLITKKIRSVCSKFEGILTRYGLKKNQGLNLQQFESVTVDIAGFSTYCNKLLFDKIISHRNKKKKNRDHVTLSMFMQFWNAYFIENEDASFRFIQLLSNDKNFKKSKKSKKYLVKENFIPLINEILLNHPGLHFLRESDNKQFHTAYIDTVIARIFYKIDADEDGKISMLELSRSNFLEMLIALDSELDINECFDYFSYEHFYVIYSKFWELTYDEANGDEHTTQCLLTYDDLIKYSDYSLTPLICQRIMNGFWRKTQLKDNKNYMNKHNHTMNYEDFIYFIISEEDKTTTKSINYWFRLLDIDGDGILSPYEMKQFFDQQTEKIYKLCGEHIQFENILTRLNDIISPKIEFNFTISDIKKSKMAKIFFDTLINIKKFASSQSSHNDGENDSYKHQFRNAPHMSDWDKFASSEYFTLTNDP